MPFCFYFFVRRAKHTHAHITCNYLHANCVAFVFLCNATARQQCGRALQPAFCCSSNATKAVKHLTCRFKCGKCGIYNILHFSQLHYVYFCIILEHIFLFLTRCLLPLLCVEFRFGDNVTAWHSEVVCWWLLCAGVALWLLWFLCCCALLRHGFGMR